MVQWRVCYKHRSNSQVLPATSTDAPMLAALYVDELLMLVKKTSVSVQENLIASRLLAKQAQDPVVAFYHTWS